ncbi:reverse transcriptase [Tanacetum coccineum]
MMPIQSGDISILSLLVDHGSPRSLQLWDTSGSGRVNILIDNGSTHNFVQPGVVERMHLPITCTKPFKVYIGSGETLLCENMYAQVTIDIQGSRMDVDLYVLPMKGPDIVLGIQWSYYIEPVKLKKSIIRGHIRQVQGMGTFSKGGLDLSTNKIFDTQAASRLLQPFPTPTATDGQIEVVNRSLEQYLWAMVLDRPHQWLRENLLAARNRMEMQANRSRREVEFNVGDKVLVKLQPYR